MRPLKVLSPKDLAEINAFLDELQDESKYKARFEALEAMKKEINGLIEVYGKASDIDRIVSHKLEQEETARKILEQAIADRETTKTEIESDKAASRKFITERENAARARIADREAALLAGETNLGIREKALAKANDELITHDLKVAADLTLAKEIRTKYTEAVASLKMTIESTQRKL